MLRPHTILQTEKSLNEVDYLERLVSIDVYPKPGPGRAHTILSSGNIVVIDFIIASST